MIPQTAPLRHPAPAPLPARDIVVAAGDGIGPEHRTGVLLKAPITTPEGGGVKSLNVTIRKTLGLFANVRPSRSYHPFVRTHHPNLDVVIVRENEEDLYTGIEHRQTDEVYQCLKLISRPGCERIIRYAFEYASQRPRRKLTCMTKDNIMKMTDGRVPSCLRRGRRGVSRCRNRAHDRRHRHGPRGRFRRSAST
jgi:isocitrate dehydrogenase